MGREEYKRELAERVGLIAARTSQYELAKRIGVATSTMSGYLGSLQGFTVPVAIAHCCPEISLEWLFRGEGAMLIGTPEPPTPEPEAKPLPHPGADPAIIKILLDRIEQQAVTIADLTTENQRYRTALGLK